ncbi:DUF218 domain-containing protein [Apodospora peruviana]|uniref:DUF218 domain-containing protein n=1 Tax=Apodospora peruviana TaxID=516989 RepID=A0AAE0I6X5_9PEZI|nr:DUF218 domain-containing protein [Apodospora peruviana]
MGDQITSTPGDHPAPTAPATTPRFPGDGAVPPIPDTGTIDADAATIYNYHRMRMPLFPPSSSQHCATAIFCLCSLDIRVAHRAAELYLTGHGAYLIFSGNVGALTAGRFTAPEAEVFAAVARDVYEIPAHAILVEPAATNTGENVRFTRALLASRGIFIKRFTLVQKPYMERRTFATFVKQWPSSSDSSDEVDFCVTSPQLEWDEYPDAENPKELVTSIMVGDLVRIRDYPAKGFQIPQEIPEEVWQAAERLIAAGYTAHLPN